MSIKIGFLIDSFMIPAWSYEAIQKALTNDGVAPCVVVIKKHKKSELKGNKSRIRKIIDGKISFEVLKNSLYYRYAEWDKERYISSEKDAHKLMDLRILCPDVPILEVSPRETKFCDWIEGDDLGKIRTLEPDLLFRVGFRILKGEILSLPKYGTWSYHHGDPEKYRGGPSGFWETYHGAGVVGAVLQKLNASLDAGTMLARVISPSSYESPALTRNMIAWDSVELLKLCIQKLINTGSAALKQNEQILSTGPLYKTPGPWTTIHMVLKFLYRKIINNSRFFVQHWSLFIATNFDNKYVFSGIHFRNLKKIKAPKGKFWADPFLIKSKNRNYIFFEEYSYSQRKGRIKVAEIEHGELKNEKIALETENHLSNPFVFIENDDIYLLPEQSESHEIALYKSTSFPCVWEKAEILLKGGCYVDPVLIKRNGVYWLFFVERISNNGSTTTYSRLYFSSLLKGPWEEHPKSPISTDCRFSRSAGSLFNIDGKLIRPVQDCSQGYGYLINYLEITTLSKTEYIDKKVAEISPHILNLDGIHTINFMEDILVVDGRKKNLRCRVE